MNAERRFLVEQVIKAAHDKGIFIKGETTKGFRLYKKHLEQFTDDEIREELKRLNGE